MGQFRRRRFLIGAGALASASLTIQAQQQEKTRLIGFLGFSNAFAAKSYVAVFTDELRKRGWVEGRNVSVNYLYAEGDGRKLEALAANLVALRPDVAFTTNGQGALALKRASRDTPIVFAGLSDPVSIGLVRSLRAPGGNVTGYATTPTDDLVGKRLQLFKECFPHVSRLAVLLDLGEPENKRYLSVLQKYAVQLEIQAVQHDVPTASHVGAALASIERDRPDALYVFTNAPTYVEREAIASHAIRTRTPTMGNLTQLVEAGLLIGYAPSFGEIIRQGVKYVDLILRGAKPADLPVEQPTRYELTVNLRTAKAIGVTIPPSILLRADRVIK